jgi:hypothetical protein
LNQFAKKTIDTKQNRATWGATVNTFLERALIEQLWGEGDKGHDVTVTQFKNKLKDHKTMRTRMLNRDATPATNGSDTLRCLSPIC